MSIDSALSTTHYRDSATGANYRVSIFSDQDAESPRGNDNPTILVTDTRGWKSPDKGFDVDDFVPGDFIEGRRIDPRRASRYLNLFRPDVLAFSFLRHDECGLTSYTTGEYSDDDRFDGIAVVTRESWKVCMGDYPVEGGEWAPGQRTQSAREAIDGDVASYNRWAAGEYVGFVIEQLVAYQRTTEGDWSAYQSEPPVDRMEWVELDSLWGIDDDTFALTEAVSYLPATATETYDVPDSEN